MTAEFENQILYLIDQYKRLDWKEINELLVKDFGYEPNPNFLHYKLKKLRDEKKIIFLSIGDFTFYQISCFS
jgi:hypothetical protein